MTDRSASPVRSPVRGPDRRAFLAMAGLATLLGPRPGAAQALARVGLLAAPAPENYGHHIDAIRKGLKEMGFVEGRNLALEFRWANGEYDRLPALASELARSRVEVILTLGGGPPVRAAKAATSTIPIVFHLGADPVKAGLVASMSRPGGNITGVTLMTNSLETKRLELLRAMVPAARRIAILANPDNASAAMQIAEIRAVAPRLRVEVMIVEANREPELEDAFAQARAGAEAMSVLSDVFFTSNSAQLAALSLRHRLPAIAHSREFTEAGGLMSYGTNLTEAYRLAGAYAGRILKGEKPAELPVIEPTRFDLVINLKTAKVLDLAVSPELLARADEVIE